LALYPRLLWQRRCCRPEK